MLHVGALAELTSVARDHDGDLTDPDTIEIDVFPPSAILTGDTPDEPTTYVYGTDAELTRVEIGVYRLAFTPDEAGGWRYRWRTTGDVQDIAAGELWVTPTDFDTARTTGITPTVEEVAHVLLDRRHDALGNDQRTFTDDTKPSARDAERAIPIAERLVTAELGPALTEEGVSNQAALLARDAIAHRAALSLVAYLPEPEPERPRIQADYDSIMAALKDLLEGQTPRRAGLVSATLVVWPDEDDQLDEGID